MNTIENPGKSTHLLWIRDVALPYRGDDCLIWPFSRTLQGYGKIDYNKTRINAHRFICRAARGDPPDPKYHAAHSCHNGHKGCVNWRHLSWKTPSDNAKDQNWKPGFKLTAENVADIRSLDSSVTDASIAIRYDVRENTIRKVRNYMTWKNGVKAKPGFLPGDPRNVGWKTRIKRLYERREIEAAQSTSTIPTPDRKLA